MMQISQTNMQIEAAKQGMTFPPSAADSPFAYGFALFSTSFVSVVSVAVLLTMFVEWRRSTENRLPLRLPLKRNCSDLNVALRVAVCCFCTMFITGVLPDALVLLAWGEVSIPTLSALLIMDRMLDGFFVFPFITGSFIVAWIWPSLTQSVAEVGPRNAMPPLNRHFAMKVLRVPALLLLISIGVTIGKASA